MFVPTGILSLSQCRLMHSRVYYPYPIGICYTNRFGSNFQYPTIKTDFAVELIRFDLHVLPLTPTCESTH